MESIRDVLSKMQMPKVTAGANTGTLSSSCPTCGGAGWLRLDVDMGDPRFGQAVPCACKSKELEEKRMGRLLEKSNLKALQNRTFDNFFPHDDHQQRALDFAREFADRLSNPWWLVLLGGVGTGKTHLAAAIGNRRLELGEPAIFVVVPDLLDHLRSTFSPASTTEFDDLFESVRSAPLLLLDDLGTQTTTPWAAEKMFQILNHRYMMRLPTVITTNVRLEDLGDRLSSRMADPELSLPVSTGDIDLRTGKENALPRNAPPARERPRQGRRSY